MLATSCRTLSRLGGVFMLLALCSGCGQNDDGGAPQDDRTGQHSGQQLTRTIELRDPAKNEGETQRIIKRDRLGRVREIEIYYAPGDPQQRAYAFLAKDVSGRITKVKLTMIDQSVAEANATANGALEKIRGYWPDGKVMLTYDRAGSDDWKSIAYRGNGQTPLWAMEGSAQDTWTLMVVRDDGRTPLFWQRNAGNIRRSLMLYDGDGRLIYSEKHIGPDPDYHAINIYEGTIYDSTTKATHRVTINEGPADNGGGWVSLIEELASDGTVKSRVVVERRYGEPQYPLGVFAGQDALINAKQNVWTAINQAQVLGVNLQATLTKLLADKTR